MVSWSCSWDRSSRLVFGGLVAQGSGAPLPQAEVTVPEQPASLRRFALVRAHEQPPARLGRQLAEELAVRLRASAPVPYAVPRGDHADRGLQTFRAEQIPADAVELQGADIVSRTHAEHRAESTLERA